jgi:hypothetical protein
LLIRKNRDRAFENRVLRIILEPKREEVTERWRNRLNEEYFPPNTGNKIKDDEVGGAHSTNGREVHSMFRPENLMGYYLEGLGIYERVILKLMLGIRVGW